VFNHHILGSNAGKVMFAARDLVQVLDLKYKKTFLTSKKILPEWSGVFRIKERLLNLYIIETIYGLELSGEYNSRQLRPLKALKESSLEAYEAVQSVGATNKEVLAALGPVVLEAQKPSCKEEAETRKQEGAEENEDGWVDKEEADKGVDEEAEVQDETITQRVKDQGARKRATRTLPGGGG
jgi:hypothetical protein